MCVICEHYYTHLQANVHHFEKWSLQFTTSAACDAYAVHNPYYQDHLVYYTRYLQSYQKHFKFPSWW